MRVPSLAVLISVVTGAGCGRAPSPTSAWRIVSVAAEQSVVAPGTAGLAVFVSVAGQDATAELLDCELVYAGAGHGFSARLVSPVGVIEPGATQAVRFSAHLPIDGTGQATIDATARLLIGGREVTVTGSDSPYAFAYKDQATPDTSALPAIAVTLYDDDFDGPATMTTVDEAGGAGDISLREAITITNNLGTPYLIGFDPGVFDASVAQPIAVASALPAITAPGVVLDGRGLSVRLTGTSTILIAAPRIAVLGVTVESGITAHAADDLWIADTELDLVDGSQLGVTASARVRVERTQIAGVYYGPALTCTNCSDLTLSQLTVTGSVTVADSTGVVLADSQVSNLTITNSAAYVARTIADEPSAGGPTISVFENSSGTVLEDDDVAGGAACVSIDTSQNVTVTHSRLRCQTSAIVLRAGANGLLAAPGVTADVNGVSGTTGAPDGSVVGVYDGDTAHLDGWLGDATVTSGAFALASPLASGASITAVVTVAGVGTSPAAAPSVVP